MRIAIIGTAGANNDHEQMSKSLYLEMFKEALMQVYHLGKDPEKYVDLVSGGSAWSDHVAVSLWLDERVRSLSLYFPVPFTGGQFVEIGEEPDPGSRVNQLHAVFSEKMGGQSLEGISKAIEKGATTWHMQENSIEYFEDPPKNNFLARNFFIGQCDAIIAFSWGDNDNFPNDAGTIHIWKNSTARTKMHIPLHKLQERIDLS